MTEGIRLLPSDSEEEQLKLRITSLHGVSRLTEVIAPLLSAPLAIGLIGPLGAGKTTFVRNLLSQFGIPPKEVQSPSFVLECVYDVPQEKIAGGVRQVCHWDFYRLRGVDAPPDFCDRLEESGVLLLAEWPQLALVSDLLSLEIVIAIPDSNTVNTADEVDNESREFSFIPKDEKGAELLQSFRQKLVDFRY